MKQLNIGIDIDDTITNTFDYLMPAIAEFYNMDLDYLKNNNISYSNFPEEMKKKEVEFGKKYYEKIISDVPIKPDAKEYIEKIKKLGHKITIITARSHLYYQEPYKLSEQYLTKNKISYDKLICSFEKAKTCKEEKIDILIDDSIENCDDVKKNGINVLLFASKANSQNKEHHKVYSWEDVYNYIKKYS